MKNMSYIKYKEINFEPQQQALSPTGHREKKKKKILGKFLNNHYTTQKIN